MKKQVATPIIVIAIAVVVVLVGYLGWKALTPDNGAVNLPPPPPPKETAGMEAHPRPMVGGMANSPKNGK